MDINHPRIRILIQKLADENRIPYEAAKRVVVSQFECVMENMKKVDVDNNYFPYIKLPHLFTFKVKDLRKQSLIELNKINNNVYTQERED